MYKKSKNPLSIVRGVVFAAAISAALPVTAADPGTLPKTIEPLVQMEGGKIRVCGIEAKFGTGSPPLTVVFRLERHDRTAEFVVEARPGEGTSRLSALRILPLSGVPLMFSTSSPGAAGGWQLRTPANGSSVTQFIQELMVRGTGIEVGAAEWSELHRFTITGPLSQSVRASYLNCAGDLYLPGE